MPTTQMNVRLDSELKAAGDAVLEREGVTPSQMVRAIWEWLVVEDRVPDEARAALNGWDFDAKEFERELRLEAVERGANLVRDFYRKFDIPEPDRSADDYYDALMEEAMRERFPEYL